MHRKNSDIFLFKLFGFEVRLNPSWFFLALLIAWTLAVGYFPFLYRDLSVLTYWIMGIFGAIGLFVSIVFHELCHSLVGRRYGLPITGIQLFIFGGVAEMHEEPANAKTEFLMAVAGPISSAFLGACFYLLFIGGFHWQWPPSVIGVLRYLGIINFALAIFNLLPGFPLDGGRIFRSILWGWKQDFPWATRVACNWGEIMGWVLIFLGIILILRGGLIGGIWLGLIGYFLKNTARASFQNFLIRQTFHGEKIRKYTKPNPISVTPETSIQTLVDDYFHKHYYKMYPVCENDEIKGYISFEEIKTQSRENWSHLKVGDVMQACTEEMMIDANNSVVQALQKMLTEKIGRLIVTEQGKLLGIISLRDLTHIIALKMNLPEE
jgi:Zn-dependent protease